MLHLGKFLALFERKNYSIQLLYQAEITAYLCREFRRRFPRRPAACARRIKRLTERLVQTGSTRDVARNDRASFGREYRCGGRGCLRESNIEEISNLEPGVLQAVIQNAVQRAQMCINLGDGHFTDIRFSI